jgi:LacI family transcriptional regulator
MTQETTERLLSDHPDLAGLDVSAGGISGALAAMRGSGLAGSLVAVGYNLTEVKRAAFLDGALTLVISHPLDQLARAAMGGMVRSCLSVGNVGPITMIVPFELFTRENL